MLLVVLFVFSGLAGAASQAPAAPGAAVPARTWALGFGVRQPLPRMPAVAKIIDLWSRRAEIAAFHQELPWRDLLAGVPADTILDRDKAQLVKYLRAKGLKIYFMADSSDGLARGKEARQLRALGRSLREPEVQAAYRRYVLAFARRFQPEYIGLAAETNLVRANAPPALYAAVKRTANDTAAALRAAGSKAILLTSVQVDAAWGRLGGGGYYRGVETDFADFPFMQVLGLSSYPYFAYARPEDIPDTYYSRLLNGRELPVMIVESGWNSASVGPLHSSPAHQARYLTRLARLADGVRARGVIQLLFTDIDTRRLPKRLPATLQLFAHIGLVDADLRPKPALVEWDKLYRRPLRPGARLFLDVVLDGDDDAGDLVDRALVVDAAVVAGVDAGIGRQDVEGALAGGAHAADADVAVLGEFLGPRLRVPGGGADQRHFHRFEVGDEIERRRVVHRRAFGLQLQHGLGGHRGALEVAGVDGDLLAGVVALLYAAIAAAGEFFVHHVGRHRFGGFLEHVLLESLSGEKVRQLRPRFAQLVQRLGEGGAVRLDADVPFGAIGLDLLLRQTLDRDGLPAGADVAGLVAEDKGGDRQADGEQQSERRQSARNAVFHTGVLAVSHRA
jgi:hypothetical protein